MTTLLRLLRRWRRHPLATRWWAYRPVVRQYDQMDCGPAALLSVLRAYGGDSSLPEVRRVTHTGNRGASLLGLCAGAEALGFSAHGARGSYEELRAERLPCIAHLVLETGQQHFVVVYETTDRQVTIGDPGRGVHRLPVTEFTRLWETQAVLLLSPGTTLVDEPAPHWLEWMTGLVLEQPVWFSQVIFLGLLVTLGTVGAAALVQLLIDALQRGGHVHGATLAAWLMGALLVARGATGFLRSRFLVQLTQRVSRGLTDRIVERIFQLPLLFFESRRIGDVTARITDGVRVQMAAVRVLGSALIDLMLVVASLAAVCVIGNELGLLVLAFMPLLVAVLARATRSLRQQQTETLEAFASAEAGAIDALRGIRVVRGFDVGGPMQRANAEAFGRYYARQAVLGNSQARIGFEAELLGALLVCAVLVAGTWLIGVGALTLGTLMATYTLATSELTGSARLAEAYVSLQGAAASANRVSDLLLHPPETSTGERPYPEGATLRCDRVDFSWTNAAPLLRDVSLALTPGVTVGLSGSSGTGKSTLVKLLQRHYMPTAGALLVDDVPAHAIDLGAYRRQVAVLSEETPIFSDSLLHNVALGREAVTPERASALVARLGLGVVMSRFAGGWHAPIGEKGRHLSAGERQLVGLLRALAGELAVLILDEGLNGMDPALMRQSLLAVTAYAAEHAVLLVSHDERVLAVADVRLVLEHGSIRSLPIPPARLAMVTA